MSAWAPDHPDAEFVPSPNFGPRIGVTVPDMIILHYTGMETGEGAQNWLCNPESQVSSHYLVHEGGRIVQMVRESERAWHAGKSFWAGATDINSRSVGIEIVNPGHILGYSDFPAVQIAAVIRLCRGIVARYGVFAERILAHSDIAPGRKVDPGEKFPWKTLCDEGLGRFPAPARIEADFVLRAGDSGESVQNLQSLLARYGYNVEITGNFDAATEIVVTAFQRHFQPERVNGQADATSVEILKTLVGRTGSDIA